MTQKATPAGKPAISLTTVPVLDANSWNEFVTRLHHHNTADGRSSHGTNEPLFIVQSKDMICGFEDGFSGERYVYDGESSFASPQEYWDALDAQGKHALNGQSLETEDELFCDLSENTQWDILGESEGLTVSRCRPEWRFISAHLTREAAEAFIARKGHDYNELRVYVSSQAYCVEFNSIKKGILDGLITFNDPEQPQAKLSPAQERYINKIAPTHSRSSCGSLNESHNGQYSEDDTFGGGCYRCTLIAAALGSAVPEDEDV